MPDDHVPGNEPGGEVADGGGAGDAGNADPDQSINPVDSMTFDEQVNRTRENFQPTPMEKFVSICKSLLLRAMVIYFVMSFLRGNSSTPKTATPGGAPVNSLASTNLYENGTLFDLFVYTSESDQPNFKNLLWKQTDLIYGDWYGGENSDGIYTANVRLQLSEKAQQNGSIYIHTFIVPGGYSPDPNEKPHSKLNTIRSTKLLNKFKKKRYGRTHNLLTGETAASLEEQEKASRLTSEIISHWHPNVTIALVTDWTAWTAGSVPSPLNNYIEFIPMEQKYKPVIFYNDYWNLAKDYQVVNTTVSHLDLQITYTPLSLFKWQIYAAQSVRNQWNLLASDEEDEDQDTLKETILETNPYLLGLTFGVSILHSIFEFLAFKNDIQFWNNRKSLEGLSVRSVFFNVFQSLIVLLYVLDNDTNFVIRLSVGVGLLIEMWKINKVMDVKLDRENLYFNMIPGLKFTDKGSYVESSTRKFDMLAFRYLSWALFPLLIGYAVYSLLYVEQKGWYSWVLSLLYGFLLTFGFIMMTPQLFINYKLKSVAHLPWRMLSYKFLNTFIDDIFAFVIKMPTMYRIGCFRDDIVFFVFLYQLYIYRVDPTRVNEFGVSKEMLEKAGGANEQGGSANGAIEGGANEQEGAKAPTNESKKDK